jgi:hypothetical protein
MIEEVIETVVVEHDDVLNGAIYVLETCVTFCGML